MSCEMENIIVSSIVSSTFLNSQIAYIPHQILKDTDSNKDWYFRISTFNESYICKGIKIFKKENKRIIATMCVTEGLKSKVDTIRNDSLKDISPLKMTNLDYAHVNVIVKWTGNILDYQKNSVKFIENIKSLLMCYKITTNCKILCAENPLAKMFDILEVTIHDTSLKQNEIGSTKEYSKIYLNNIQSEEALKMKVKCNNYLGGLTDIFNELCNYVKLPWNLIKDKSTVEDFFVGGILLTGPPGCGKTTLIRQVCSSTNALLVAASLSDIISEYPEETLKNIKKISNKAIELSKECPTVFFIDEIDSLCPQRSQESSYHDIRLMGTVICMIDKCLKQPFLTLFAATNRLYSLDSSVRSSHRFPVEIYINTPTTEERSSILKTHLNMNISEMNLNKVANATPGYVGADLELLADMVKNICTNQEEEIIIEELLHKSREIVPSIYKTLNFITSKPQHKPIGGLNFVKKDLEQILIHRKYHASLYERLGIKLPKGILLYGPRGCGKTQLVSSLASNNGFTFISANASHLLSPYVGESERKVAELFHMARLAQPSIVFIDEIDGIFGRREKDSLKVNLFTELLQALDGADVMKSSIQGSSLDKSNTIKDDVIVFAATNNPESLDPALIRPGRFDKIFFVPLPDEEARLDILKIKTRNIKIKEDDLIKLCKETEGLTGAEIENIIQQACLKVITAEEQMNLDNISLSYEDIISVGSVFIPSIKSTLITEYADFQKKLKDM